VVRVLVVDSSESAVGAPVVALERHGYSVTVYNTKQYVSGVLKTHRLASDPAAKVSKPGRTALDSFRNPETPNQPSNVDSSLLFKIAYRHPRCPNVPACRIPPETQMSAF